MLLFLGGELSARLSSEEEDKVILRALESVGYGSEYLEEMGFPGWEIHKIFTEQSPDISRGVDLQGSVGSSMKEVISGGYIFPWELV